MRGGRGAGHLTTLDVCVQRTHTLQQLLLETERQKGKSKNAVKVKYLELENKQTHTHTRAHTHMRPHTHAHRHTYTLKKKLPNNPGTSSGHKRVVIFL